MGIAKKHSNEMAERLCDMADNMSAVQVLSEFYPTTVNKKDIPFNLTKEQEQYLPALLWFFGSGPRRSGRTRMSICSTSYYKGCGTL